VKNRKRAGVALGVALGLAGCANLASRVLPSHNQVTAPDKLRAGAYRLDPDHATVLFEVDHLGFSGYIGRFNTLDATLDFDPQAPQASLLDVSVDAASVDTPSDKLDAMLRGGQMFDVAKNPLLRFRSTGITVTGATTGAVTGVLTMNGISKPVTLEVTFNGGAPSRFTGKYTLGFAARSHLKRSDWGLTGWLPAVGDDVIVTIRAEFLKA
jgi:polyisoprenoid-binding protein YceI